jgi:PiT family inorganic phosphate transporter
MLDLAPVFAIFIVGVALVFDFINGFHDSANSIATVVSTRVLTPLQGVVWAAVFNFISAFTFGTAVAHTIGAGLIDVNRVDNTVIFSGLVGAIVWDLLTWLLGMPTSSSHALVGGYAGAAIVKAGTNVLVVRGWIQTISFILIAPLLGYLFGTLFIIIIYNIFRRQTPAFTDKIFRRGQLVSAAFYSLGHGTNDAQKTMGIIAGVFFTVPVYRHLSGGWRIVHTVGSKITRLRPLGGFAAETAGALTIFLSSSLGIPVSTTHVITGAIIGVGSVQRLRAVHWSVAGRILWAWLFTIPASALISAALYGMILTIQRLF